MIQLICSLLLILALCGQAGCKKEEPQGTWRYFSSEPCQDVNGNYAGDMDGIYLDTSSIQWGGFMVEQIININGREIHVQNVDWELAPCNYCHKEGK